MKEIALPLSSRWLFMDWSLLVRFYDTRGVVVEYKVVVAIYRAR